MKNIFTLFNSTMTDLEQQRKIKIDKVNNIIIPATTANSNRVKSFKSNLDSISGIKKSKEKQQNEISKAQTKKDFEKAGKLTSELKMQEDKERQEGNVLENGLADFESQRVMDNKYLLLHYIHSELAFHATALEKLSKLYGEIICHDPREKLPEFIHNFNLNSLKDTNLANKYGFTPGDTQRKLERLKNVNQQGTTNVAKSIVNVANPSPKTFQNSKTLFNMNKLDDDLSDNSIKNPTNKATTSLNFTNIKSNQLTSNK
jgi:hypothetical protein